MSMLQIGVISLGCAKNRVDTERMLGIIAGAGHAIVNDPASADVLIVNTCGFIESAREEGIEAILDMARHKGKLIVTGCMAQRYADELMNELPEIDGLLGVAQYSRILDAIADITTSGLRPKYTRRVDEFLESPRILTTPNYSAYVKISEGCSNKCTYCAIPLIRGDYRSRPYGDIMRECEALIHSGVKEITLIAQDTSRYGEDLYGARTLPKLLKDAARLNVEWVRVLYTYPDSADDALIEAIASTDKICKYMDLPLQHINADILSAMNRRGSPDSIVKTLSRARNAGLKLRTTMIVGFPGETHAQFEELLSFVKDMRFDALGAFAYCPEEGTPAAIMPRQIDEDEKQSRLRRLMTAQREISLERQKLRIGSIEKALIEGENMARTQYEAPEVDGKVFITTENKLIPGEFVNVRITKAAEYDLQGELA